MGLLLAGAGVGRSRTPVFAAPPSRSIPLIHTTDLYHPPQDPDDQIDLATVLALEECDLRGVVLDITETFLHPAPRGWDIAREPGFLPVRRMAELTGRAIPVAQGPHRPMERPACPPHEPAEVRRGRPGSRRIDLAESRK